MYPAAVYSTITHPAAAYSTPYSATAYPTTTYPPSIQRPIAIRPAIILESLNPTNVHSLQMTSPVQNIENPVAVNTNKKRKYPESADPAHSRANRKYHKRQREALDLARDVIKQYPTISNPIPTEPTISTQTKPSIEHVLESLQKIYLQQKSLYQILCYQHEATKRLQQHHFTDSLAFLFQIMQQNNNSATSMSVISQPSFYTMRSPSVLFYHPPLRPEPQSSFALANPYLTNTSYLNLPF
jgi:hypothetical protein